MRDEVKCTYYLCKMERSLSVYNNEGIQNKKKRETTKRLLTFLKLTKTNHIIF